VLGLFDEFVVLAVPCFEKLFHDGISAFTVQLDVASLLVFDNDGHSFARAVELKDIEHSVALFIAIVVFHQNHVVGFTTHELKSLGFGSFHK